MSNALMAKFNMKGAKGEKVGFTKKTVYTAIKGIYASLFFLYCIIPRLIPAQSLLEHLFSFINYSPFSEKNPQKNPVFSHSRKGCFRDPWLQIKNFAQAPLRKS